MSAVLAALDARAAGETVLRGDAGALDAATLRGRIEALAAALDLDAADLAHGIESVLGASRAQADELIARLKGTRTIGGLQARVGAVVMPREAS